MSNEELAHAAVAEETPVEVAEAVNAASDSSVPRTRSAKESSASGWKRASLTRMLNELYGLSMQRDVLIDGMHNIMSLVKDLAHATVSMFQGHNQELWLDKVLQQIRAMLPNVFTNGRRVPHDLSHAALKSWAAEECLVWLRLIWRLLFQECLDAKESREETGELFYSVMRAWELLEAALLPLIDRRGTQGTIEDQLRPILEYIEYLKSATVDGVRVFSAAYVTYSVHQIVHIPMQVSDWGNLWESWCFVFERIAGDARRIHIYVVAYTLVHTCL